MEYLALVDNFGIEIKLKYYSKLKWDIIQYFLKNILKNFIASRNSFIT